MSLKFDCFIINIKYLFTQPDFNIEKLFHHENNIGIIS